jgi:hypothetical protein
MILMYYAIKVMAFASILKSLVTFESLQKRKFALALFYTVLVGFLSYVFFILPSQQAPYWLWKHWLIANFLLTALYFWLIVRFEDSGLFWVLLPFASVVVLNEPELVAFWLKMIAPSLVPQYLHWVGMASAAG